MPQIFRPRANTLARLTLFGGVFALLAGIGIAIAVAHGPYASGAGRAPPQPIPFSHEHHVGGLGLDCRLCHGFVESSGFAGLPPTGTCLKCHSELWTDAPMLQALHASAAAGTGIAWTRVYDLPDFVYFDHAIHVRQGVGCVVCHGRVDRMALTVRARDLHMEGCLECHRAPERFLRPRERVFDLDWQADDQRRLGMRLVARYGIETGPLNDCSICHR